MFFKKKNDEQSPSLVGLRADLQQVLQLAITTQQPRVTDQETLSHGEESMGRRAERAGRHPVPPSERPGLCACHRASGSLFSLMLNADQMLSLLGLKFK